MRCPKCGYISFDDQVHCRKCAKDLLALGKSLRGGGIGTLSPHSLVLCQDKFCSGAEIAEIEIDLEAETGSESAGEIATAISEPVAEIDFDQYLGEIRGGDLDPGLLDDLVLDDIEDVLLPRTEAR